jgi:hypothetical protein
MSKFRTLLLVSTLIPLAACGADNVASPGEAFYRATPARHHSAAPAADVSGADSGWAVYRGNPAGMTDRGVIGGRPRCSELPPRFTAGLRRSRTCPAAVYQIKHGPVNVGTDVGGDGTAAGGQAVTLTIQPGRDRWSRPTTPATWSSTAARA